MWYLPHVSRLIFSLLIIRTALTYCCSTFITVSWDIATLKHGPICIFSPHHKEILLMHPLLAVNNSFGLHACCSTFLSDLLALHWPQISTCARSCLNLHLRGDFFAPYESTHLTYPLFPFPWSIALIASFSKTDSNFPSDTWICASRFYGQSKVLSRACVYVSSLCLLILFFVLNHLRLIRFSSVLLFSQVLLDDSYQAGI